MAAAFPELSLTINGGITDLDMAEHFLACGLKGAMIGRAAYHTPWLLAQLEQQLHGTPLPDRIGVLRDLEDYVEVRLAAGARLINIVRHWCGIAHGLPGARAFRSHLVEQGRAPEADWRVVEAALSRLSAPASEAA